MRKTEKFSNLVKVTQLGNDETFIHSPTPGPRLFTSFLCETTMAMNLERKMKLFIESYLPWTPEILIVIVRQGPQSLDSNT